MSQNIIYLCFKNLSSGTCANHCFPVAPRLRATGLPCIASPEIMSSGNTQHIGTENNRFIDASGTEFILQQWSRPSGTLGAAEQYVHYLVNIKGPRLEQLRGSGITS